MVTQRRVAVFVKPLGNNSFFHKWLYIVSMDWTRSDSFEENNIFPVMVLTSPGSGD